MGQAAQRAPGGPCARRDLARVYGPRPTQSPGADTAWTTVLVVPEVHPEALDAIVPETILETPDVAVDHSARYHSAIRSFMTATASY